MNIKRKQISILNNLLSGIGIMTLGIIVIVGSINMYTKVVSLFIYIFILYGVSKLLRFLLNKKIVRNRRTLISIILNIVFGLLMLMFPKVSLSLLPLIFSLYLLLYAIINFIDYIILKENELSIRFKYLMLSMIFLIISLVFLFYPLEKLNLFIMIIGIYCLILGLSEIYEFIIDLLTDKFKLRVKQKIKMTLPLFFEAFVPKKALLKINKYLDVIIDTKTENKESDLQIFIHLSNHGFNQFGHMDICFNDKIYSYGNYDNKSKKLFESIGDGILFTVNDKEKYIKFCIDTSKKTMVEFGIKLTKKQKEKLQKEIDVLLQNTYSWNPLEINKKNNDYASKLYKATKCKFYKFKSGEYKTYFVMGVNCIYFIDQLLFNSISGNLKLAGVMSPGTYYQVLDENYKKKNGIVISKKIYNKEMYGDYYVENKK